MYDLPYCSTGIELLEFVFDGTAHNGKIVTQFPIKWNFHMLVVTLTQIYS